MNDAVENWQWEIDNEGIGWLGLDKPGGSANTLSRGVLVELDMLLTDIGTEPPAGLVLYSKKDSGFVAGADITEFTKIDTPEQAYEAGRAGQQVLARLARLPYPTVAAIDGFALGGGLELALACDYRVAAESGKRTIGFPEVQLGLHPGFGGTVRAVKYAGVLAAMDLMLTGRSITPGGALKIGLLDALAASNELHEAARNIAITRPRPRRPALWLRVLNWAPLRGLVAAQLNKRIAARARREHYPAPFAMVDLWREFGARGASAYEAEALSFARLMATGTSRNLVRVFFLQDRMKRLGKQAKTPVQRVHVVGAGVMGGDIAAWCALRGLSVTLQDRADEYVQPAIKRARDLFAKRLKDPALIAEAEQRLTPDVAATGVAEADLIIEAIFEDLEAKKALYASLEPHMKAGTLLATNTSSIPLESLAEGLAHPEGLLGLHFFNPVAKLPLVELVKSKRVDPAAVDTGLGFVRQISKLPLPCSSAPGFVVNRILAPYMAEAFDLYAEGVPLEKIDAAAEAFGMPMGPVELADNVGLDVALHVARILGGAFDRPIPNALEQQVAAGHLGRKSGRGFYEYRDGKAVKPARQAGRSSQDLQDRLILPMLNEAVACLRDSVVEDADLLDGGVIFGTGFAPFTGGPLQYARTVGIDEIRRRLNNLADAHGEHFRPNEGWESLSSR